MNMAGENTLELIVKTELIKCANKTKIAQI